MFRRFRLHDATWSVRNSKLGSWSCRPVDKLVPRHKYNSCISLMRKIDSTEFKVEAIPGLKPSAPHLLCLLVSLPSSPLQSLWGHSHHAVPELWPILRALRWTWEQRLSELPRELCLHEAVGSVPEQLPSGLLPGHPNQVLSQVSPYMPDLWWYDAPTIMFLISSSVQNWKTESSNSTWLYIQFVVTAVQALEQHGEKCCSNNLYIYIM